jgi:phage recombination protein Bet
MTEQVENNNSTVAIINKELNQELADPKALQALLSTTFKGLTALSAKQAMTEGMLRGFKFKDFLEKNVYAIPFKDWKSGVESYSLITSIDYVRKVAMRSGLAGKSKPEFVEADKKIISCTITIKRNVDGNIGDYTSTVYFDEYSTGKNLWEKKPHTMIAKVAEMHALRSAFPEEMAQNYIEEEMQKEVEVKAPELDIEAIKKQLGEAKNGEELKKFWVSIPAKAKADLKDYKNDLKKTYENEGV